MFPTPPLLPEPRLPIPDRSGEYLNIAIFLAQENVALRNSIHRVIATKNSGQGIDSMGTCSSQAREVLPPVPAHLLGSNHCCPPPAAPPPISASDFIHRGHRGFPPPPVTAAFPMEIEKLRLEHVAASPETHEAYPDTPPTSSVESAESRAATPTEANVEVVLQPPPVPSAPAPSVEKPPDEPPAPRVEPPMTRSKLFTMLSVQCPVPMLPEPPPIDRDPPSPVVNEINSRPQTLEMEIASPTPLPSFLEALPAIPCPSVPQIQQDVQVVVQPDVVSATPGGAVIDTSSIDFRLARERFNKPREPSHPISVCVRSPKEIPGIINTFTRQVSSMVMKPVAEPDAAPTIESNPEPAPTPKPEPPQFILPPLPTPIIQPHIEVHPAPVSILLSAPAPAPAPAPQVITKYIEVESKKEPDAPPMPAPEPVEEPPADPLPNTRMRPNLGGRRPNLVSLNMSSKFR